MFITGLLDGPHQSFEIQDDNAKVPSEDQFVAAYDAGSSSCNESSDDESETSGSAATHHRPIHYDFKKQFHCPHTKPTKKESRWDSLTLGKNLCTPRRRVSPSRGGAANDKVLSGGKQDFGLRMPLRSLAIPPELGLSPMQNINDSPRDRLLSTFDLVEEAINVCNNSQQLLM